MLNGAHGKHNDEQKGEHEFEDLGCCPVVLVIGGEEGPGSDATHPLYKIISKVQIHCIESFYE